MLPKPVLVCVKDVGLWSVFGAATLTRAQVLDGGVGRLHCDVGRFVWLDEPLRLTPDGFRYHNVVARLKQDFEMQARRAPAAVGGIVNDHFQEFSTAVWRVIMIEPASMHSFVRGSAVLPRRFSTVAEVARLMGVVAEPVAELGLHPAEVADLEANADVDPLEAALAAAAVAGGRGDGNLVAQCCSDFAGEHYGS